MTKDRGRLTAAGAAFAMMVVATAGAGAQTAAPALPAWIVGCWAGDVRGERVHERWIAADGDTLIGTSHTLKGDTLSAFEFLRVVRKNGRVVYLAQPGGAPPTEFAASATDPGLTAITFENPEHDFPKRIGYQRVDETHLTAWIDGGRSGGGRRFEFPMQRARCEP